MKIIVLFGPPGSGKGTQADILKNKYNFKHISTGDLFRYNLKNNTAVGIEAKKYIDKGNLVPDEITSQMLKEELERSTNEKGLILDGYPRNISQVSILENMLKQVLSVDVDLVLVLEVEDQILIDRISKRALDSGRNDDADIETIKNRIKIYYEQAYSVLQEYERLGKKVSKVAGAVGSIEDISNSLIKEINNVI